MFSGASFFQYLPTIHLQSILYLGPFAATLAKLIVIVYCSSVCPSRHSIAYVVLEDGGFKLLENTPQRTDTTQMIRASIAGRGQSQIFISCYI